MRSVREQEEEEEEEEEEEDRGSESDVMYDDEAFRL